MESKTLLPTDIPVILASNSPRRRALLTEMGIAFTVMSPNADESYPPMMHPHEAVRFIAEKKARAVADERFAAGAGKAVIIASDTLVEVDGEPLGKPKDAEDAERMLRLLSGRHHNVHTGVCVIYGKQMLSAVDTTDVFFLPLDATDIHDYIASGEPMDKAGAYAIQGHGGRFVSHVNGHMDTVIGLPCELLEELLTKLVF